MSDNPSLANILREFNLIGESALLPGGSTQVFRCGSAVLKHIHETSLENNHSLALIQWIAGFSQSLRQEGFRVPLAIPTTSGGWITDGGWTAWAYLEGRHAVADDIAECISAILAFHRSLTAIPSHPAMENNQTPWGLADRGCWGEKPPDIHPRLKPLVNRLYTLRRPITRLKAQLIHADLNSENILIAPGLPPAFLDISPFWGYPEFALAIFANFIGPRKGDVECLSYFKDIPEFDQLLIRAGIRMLLVMSPGGRLENWETSSEKRAAELILDYVSAR